MNATTMYLTVNGGTLSLVLCADGRYRWFLGNTDTEVSGATIREARDAAYAAWPEAEQLN